MSAAAELEAPAPRLRVAVAGANGRMGQMLIEQVLAAPDLQLAAALVRVGSESLGRAAGSTRMAEDCAANLNGAEVLIDFTRPDAAPAHLEMARSTGCALVLGTTGFDATAQAALTQAAREQRLLWAPNTSLGVNIVYELLAQAARRLAAADYDLEIVEAHHRHKVDAPSGTALQMGEVAAQARGVQLSDVAVRTRDGHVGARPRGAIGFATVRGGSVIGDHQALFCGEHEVIEIAHRSASRIHYATGALAAARFLLRQPTGRLYRMADVVADLETA